MSERRLPSLNHVAMSLPRDALDESGRDQIVDFYGDVFGWKEYSELTVDRELLVLGLSVYDQFLFLMGADQPLTAPTTDHFGLSVGTEQEFQDLLARTRSRASSDTRVQLEDHTVDDREVVRIHSFYVRHLLPLTVEVQWWEWPAPAGATP